MFMIDLGIDSFYSVLEVSPDATAKEIRKKFSDMDIAIRDKLDKTKDPEEKKRLEAEQLKVSAAGNTLNARADRMKYDEQNAHVRFFTIQPASIPFYRTTPDRLYVLHRVMRDFLAQKGCAVSPLTDVERTDFSADESPVDLLEKILKDIK